MGSGTTVVAAKQNGRKGIGIDMEEEYCLLAMNRILKETR
jgi:DNA modification methylase